MQGQTVIPGLYDSHIHAVTTGLGLSKLSLNHTRSIQEVVDLLEERVQNTSPGEWIEGRGWDQSKWVDDRFPTRWDLDAVSPDNPVYLLRTCAHIAVVNSKALELAGIDRNTPDPVGGVIVRDDSGEPTGLLLERPAFGMVSDLIPPETHDQMIDAIEIVGQALNEKGITSVIEPGLDPAVMRAYFDAYNEGKLTFRANMMLRTEARSFPLERCLQLIDDAGLITQFGNDMLKMGGVKVTIDGGVVGRTAYIKKGILCK